jgi:hypothetical protein
MNMQIFIVVYDVYIPYHVAGGATMPLLKSGFGL